MSKRLLFLLLLTGLCIGMLPAINNSSQPYGINVHVAGNEVLARVRDAGIKWIRIDGLWPNIEVRNNQFYWKVMDRVINFGHQNGLSMVVILSNTPAWANNNKGQNHPPSNINEWKSFVRTVVKRYKNKVGFWSIWNEPNNRTFFARSKDVFVNQIFLPAAKVIRANHGSGKIVGPDCAHLTTTGQEWYFWMKYILERGRGYIDIVSHHIYKNEGPKFIFQILEEGADYLPSVKSIITESGNQNKSFWITETGWHTNDFTQQGQADHYLDMLQRRYTAGYPHKVFFYEIIDQKDAPPWGILRSNQNTKEAYDVYRQYINGQFPKGSEPDPETEDKTCYSENLQAMNPEQFTTQTLARLHNLRKGLESGSSAAAGLVALYYRLSDELIRLTADDPLLSRVAMKSLLAIDSELEGGVDRFLTRPLDPEILDLLEEALQILENKNLSWAMERLVRFTRLNIHHLAEYKPADFLVRGPDFSTLSGIMESMVRIPLDKTLELKYK